MDKPKKKPCLACGEPTENEDRLCSRACRRYAGLEPEDDNQGEGR